MDWYESNEVEEAARLSLKRTQRMLSYELPPAAMPHMPAVTSKKQPLLKNGDTTLVATATSTW
ncbi:MAG: hypothetical protein IJV22_04490 [Bacteroidales bacterium]|nr:hypothetical protein [Bacteroidales bacterium]